MEHWTRVRDPSDDPGTEAAKKFVKYFVVEDDDGSIFREDLYMAYVRWTADSGHDHVPKQKFFQALADKIDYDVTAVTHDQEWIQRIDGIGLSFVDAF